jgi:O-methyltransferase
MKDFAKRHMPERLLERYYDFRLMGLPRHHRVVRPHTLLTPINLLFLEELARRIREQGVPGDFVECGVYQGGSAGILGFEVRRSPGRRLWLFDSFAGMPDASEHDDDLSHRIAGQYVGSERQTRRILERIGVAEDRYEIVAGWLEDTLPGLAKPEIALLHVDCDFYDPVRLCLEQLYPHVSRGGYVVLNDYGAFEGCRRATDEYLARQAVVLKPTFIDRAAVYLQKPSD